VGPGFSEARVDGAGSEGSPEAAHDEASFRRAAQHAVEAAAEQPPRPSPPARSQNERVNTSFTR